jgi:hypothetical protein
MCVPQQSRIQYHSVDKGRNKKGLERFEHLKQSNAIPGHGKSRIGRKTSTMCAWYSYDLGDIADTSIDGVDTDGSTYEDVSGDVLKQVPRSSKTCITSIEQTADSNHFQTKLCGEMAGKDESSTTIEPPINDDRSGSPPQSLFLLAPVYDHVEDELLEQGRTDSEADVSMPEGRKRSFSTIVNLFAGRKNISKLRNTGQLRSSCYATTKAATNTEEHENGVIQRAVSERAPVSLRLPSSPKLRLRQALLPIQRSWGHDFAGSPDYRDVSPAPEHRAAGYAITAKDTFTPASVQRGFDVPGQRLSSMPPLRHKRNHSAGKLLDRDGDVWAKWHSQYASLENNLFPRMPSHKDCMYKQTKDTGDLGADTEQQNRRALQ